MEILERFCIPLGSGTDILLTERFPKPDHALLLLPHQLYGATLLCSGLYFLEKSKQVRCRTCCIWERVKKYFWKDFEIGSVFTQYVGLVGIPPRAGGISVFPPEKLWKEIVLARKRT